MAATEKNNYGPGVSGNDREEPSSSQSDPPIPDSALKTIFLWDKSETLEGALPSAKNYICYKEKIQNLYNHYCQFCRSKRLIGCRKIHFESVMKKLFIVKNDEVWGVKIAVQIEQYRMKKHHRKPLQSEPFQYTKRRSAGPPKLHPKQA